MKKIIPLLYFFFFQLTWGKTLDPHNTYQWNRKNIQAYNGKTDRSPWFEWWYYKVVIPETHESFYFVYGIVNPWDKFGKLESSRSYVGMGDFQQKISHEEVFPIEEFYASHEKTLIQVGRNKATDEMLRGEILKDGNKVSWDISIKKNWAYNAEGWAMGKNYTNIEWYPAQADATCSGRIISYGKEYNFNNAPCYQDRNWGSSFPKWWFWIVSNYFKDSPGTALAIGGGDPRYFDLDVSYPTASVGLKHKGKVYKFRPNNFHKVRINISYGIWEVLAINANHKVEISASAPRDSFIDLQFVTPLGKLFHDYETLNGQVAVKIFEKEKYPMGDWKLVDVLTSEFAGIEYGSFDEYSFDQSFAEDFLWERN